MEAWSNHDWDQARNILTPNVHLTTTSTQAIEYPTDLTGIDVYINGLSKFAHHVEPGSARVIASVGDERNSLILLTVRAACDGENVTLPIWRLFQNKTTITRLRQPASVT